MFYLLIVTTILALAGAYLTACTKWQGFALWIFTNSVFMTHNYLIGEWQQAILFAVYLLISIKGLFNFRRVHG